MLDTSPSIAHRPWAIAGLALVAGLVLAACGGGGSDRGVASASGSSAQSASGARSSSGSGNVTKAFKYTKCMRANGVSRFPDPTVDASGNVQVGYQGPGKPPFDPLSQIFRTALTKCRKLLPTTNVSRQDRTQFLDAGLKFAQCMRKHGVDVPDPIVTPLPGGGEQSSLGNVDPSSPKFAAAAKTCKRAFAKLPGGGPHVVTGPRRQQP